LQKKEQEMMLQPTMLLWAVVAAVVTSAQARTSAGGACTTITDKSECCKVYDNRVSVKHASNCVPAADTFSDGSVCEAEEIIVTRGECALVGACQEHVQLASAACLGLVVDKLKVAGDMQVPPPTSLIVYVPIPNPRQVRISSAHVFLSGCRQKC
jgi:hypothetical protein